jgi:hypothetical protein
MSTVTDATRRYLIMGTRNLINYEGEDIVLFRKPGLIDDGAGSKKRAAGDDVELPPQHLYKGGLQTMGRGVSTEPEHWITTSLGDRYKEFGVLIGMPDADMAKDDYFLINADPKRRWEILFIHDDRAFQTKATIGLVK